MKKRTFLKTSLALFAGGLLGPIISCSRAVKDTVKKVIARKNWAGNLQYGAQNFYEPKTVEEVQQVVETSDKLRSLGTKHCFNKIADSKITQVSARGLNRMVDLDKDNQTVTVEAGISYGQLCPDLHQNGFALHNLASLPHISIAGACATATHGSGIANGNLPTAVSAMKFVQADGELMSLSRLQDEDKFAGAVVGLGSLGLVTELTLDIQPTFEVSQLIYLDLPESELLVNFDTIMSSGYSVSLFTDYKTDRINQVWIKEKSELIDPNNTPVEFFGAKAATRNVHPIIELSAENCTDQMGVPGPWYDRLPHFRIGFTPSSGKELQAEYFVPQRHAPEAYQAIRRLQDKIGPLLMISEIRAVAADELWMSPCNGLNCMVFHFTCEQDWATLQKVLPEIERELDPFEVRPHWGKMFTLPPAKLQERYPRLDDFKKLVQEYDPKGKFRNEFISTNLYS